MEETIERLMRPGGLDVARAFRRTRTFWIKFLKEHRRDDDLELAAAISDAQWSYQMLFTPLSGLQRKLVSLGKETMPFTCFACLYSNMYGWVADNRKFAVRLARAFTRSMVSVEIKGSAIDAVALYGLHEDDEELARAVTARLCGRR